MSIGYSSTTQSREYEKVASQQKEHQTSCVEHEISLSQQERRGNVSASSRRYYYRTYGMTIASEIEIPEILEIPPVESTDLEILTPDVTNQMEHATYIDQWFQIGDQRCQIEIPGIARYRVEGGQRLMLDRRGVGGSDASTRPGDVRLFLLGSALGVLIYQRQWLPLHVSALDTPAGVWAFTGHSGAGKSTLGAWLHHTQGWPLVSDDVAVIKPEEEEPLLHPGPSRVKLWQDALAALGIDRQGLTRDLSRHDKYHLSLDRAFDLEAKPLKALVKLEKSEPGESPSLERITGMEAFLVLAAALYRGDLGKEFYGPGEMMKALTELTEKIDVYRFRRPWNLANIDDNLSPLLNEISC
ncbi:MULTISPECIES: hypothetical protein [Halomonas]|uniref:hypothetical protein n=1 Tax=Halomonas TaxID=2745 RepID=UPI00105CE996|nr:hypothetical protein [Halomonas ventosae]